MLARSTSREATHVARPSPVHRHWSCSAHRLRWAHRHHVTGPGEQRLPGAGAVRPQDTHQQGVRRCGELGRPGGLQDRSPGARARWQCRRRGRRDRGCTRRHRALQLRDRGGGFFVHYDARTGKVGTTDGRETAPRTMPHDAFIDPKTGKPYNFTPELVTSGVSVGTPGSLATWNTALKRWGTTSIGQALRPATRLADRGFRVDKTFNLQTSENQRRFANFPATSKLFLPGGQAPAVGSILRNPDLAATYRLIAKRGVRAFYDGPLAKEIARTAQHPPKRANPDLPIPAGYLHASDLARYRVKAQAPTHVRYRGLDVYGMAPSSSGGTTVGEALNILERYRLRGMSDADALHHYLEASALAFADRGKYVGDPAYVKVPQHDLLSDKYAAERACQIDPDHAATKPVAAGYVSRYDGKCGGSTAKPSDKP